MKRVGVRAGGRPTATALQPLQCLRRCHRALRCLIGPGAGPLESSRRALRERVEFKRRGEGEGEVEVEVDSEGCGGPRGEVAVLRATSPPWDSFLGQQKNHCSAFMMLLETALYMTTPGPRV